MDFTDKRVNNRLFYFELMEVINMHLIFGIAIGYFLRPFIDLTIKVFKNAWIEYKRE